MSALKFSVRAVLVAVALLAASAQAAWAETIHVECREVHHSIILTIDLTKGTVDFTFEAGSPHLDQEGTYSATINKTAIDWRIESGAFDIYTGATDFYHLDRTTGTLNLHSEHHLPKGGSESSESSDMQFACTKTGGF